MYRVVFFGTPQFAATVLDYLAHQDLTIVGVVTNPDKPIKRSKEPVASPVKLKAEELGLPLYQPGKASSEEFVSFLKTLQADFFLVVAYSEIFKPNFLAAPPLGCLNVHASLLPKYRGAGPIQRAIWEGEKESGVSIMKLVSKMDAGDVYKKVHVNILPEMTAGDLSEKLAEVGGPALFEVLKEIKEGRAELEQQKESEVTFAPKLHSEDGLVIFSKGAKECYNQIRACTPKPGAWCSVEIKGEKKRLLIRAARLVEGVGQKSGLIVESLRPALVVSCAEGALELMRVQLESKKELSGEEFLRGLGENLRFKA